MRDWRKATQAEMEETAYWAAKNNTRWGGDFDKAYKKELDTLKELANHAPFKVVWYECDFSGFTGGITRTGEIHTEYYETLNEMGKRAKELHDIGDIHTELYENNCSVEYWFAVNS